MKKSEPHPIFHGNHQSDEKRMLGYRAFFASFSAHVHFYLGDQNDSIGTEHTYLFISSYK
jgi:hypothetical protein